MNLRWIQTHTIHQISLAFFGLQEHQEFSQVVAYNAAIDACSGRWLEAMLLNRELLQRGDAGCGGLRNRNGMNIVVDYFS